MKTRRHFLASGITLASGFSPAAMQSAHHFFMPDEGAPHDRTWMAFGAQRSIWGRRLLPEVRKNLLLIANTIAEFEPVTMLVRPEEVSVVEKSVSGSVSILEARMDDLWIRDTGPTFVINEAGEKAAVDFNFNGWGKKQTHRLDKLVAGLIAKEAGVPRIEAGLVMEGGCLEVDGEGTAILTKSCVINDNRNPGMSQADIEIELMELLGLERVLWLPGVKGQDITDGHTDFYVRFVEPGVVVAGYEPDPQFADHEITKKHLGMLKEMTDATDELLEVEVLTAPGWVRPKFESDDFAAGYVGYYACNGAIIAQEFGDEEADSKALATLKKLYPDREVIALNVDALAAGGGSIHCATQQEPQAISSS